MNQTYFPSPLRYYQNQPITSYQAQVSFQSRPGTAHPRDFVPRQNQYEYNQFKQVSPPIVQQQPYYPQTTQYLQNPYSHSLNQTQQLSGRTGLLNIGNTCYMNSVLQALFSLTKFMQQLKQDFQNMPKQQQENRYITYWLLQIYNQIEISNSVDQYLLRTFKSLVDEKMSMFYGTSQQDASEFLNLLLSRIHDEINWQKRVVKEEKIEFTNLDQLFDKFVQFVSGLKASDKTVITDSFGGVMLYEIRCQNSKCLKEKYYFESILTLTLDLSSVSKNITDIQEIIQKSMREEVIEGYQCDFCKKKTDMKKQSYLLKMPENLLFQLKRYKKEDGFWQRIFSSDNYIKNDCPINISKQLDLSQVMHQKIMEYYIGNEYEVFYYQLQGLIEHSGSTSGGHYTCKVKQQTNWCMFDDSKSYPIHQNQLERILQQNSSAYVLIYNK